MTYTFYKYHGTGNDFVVFDNRLRTFVPDSKTIARLCSRQFGIGADGVILLNKESGYDFRMVLYNADGFEGSMCGNGGRCAAAMAHMLGFAEKKMRFIAYDGAHDAEILSYSSHGADVMLGMRDVKEYHRRKGYVLMDTGSPHYVKFVEDVNAVDAEKEGRKIRYSKRFEKSGVNVNFAANMGNELIVRTYERGVEAETMSCGTGVTASALSFALLLGLEQGPVDIKTRGGNLRIHFKKNESAFTDIFLEGPAALSFTGSISI
ncbi:MAG: diaminopimelate epimerase [Bacteroidota bacterium]